jgi:hypothetical protein
MNGTSFTTIERLARLQIQDRTNSSRRQVSRRTLRRTAGTAAR